jgi:nucleoside-diphosphate kinase
MTLKPKELPMPSNNREQTLVLIKPDALKNSLTGYVLSTLSEFHTGLCFAGMKIVHVNKMLASEHYAEHREKAFFPALLEFIMGQSHYPDAPEKQRVVAIVYQGDNAVKKIRDLAGPTNPLVAREERPGCIRSLGTLAPLNDAEGNRIGERMDNLIHGSASVEEAEREIKLWFRPSDIPPAMHIFDTAKSSEPCYYKDGRLASSYVEGSVCVLAPGDIAWKSDLDALQAIQAGKPCEITPEAVVAKYLINSTSQG